MADLYRFNVEIRRASWPRRFLSFGASQFVAEVRRASIEPAGKGSSFYVDFPRLRGYGFSHKSAEVELRYRLRRRVMKCSMPRRAEITAWGV